MSERSSSNRPRARRNEASAARGSERARRAPADAKRRSGGKASAGKSSTGKGSERQGSSRPASSRSASSPPGGSSKQQQNAARSGASRPRWRSSSGGAFKLSSTRRAAVLAILVCAMALSVAVPLRNYWDQRKELAAQDAQRAEIVQQVELQEQRRAELSDPSYLEPEVRSRTGWVPPGEKPFIVNLPSAPPPPPAGGPAAGGDAPWYQRLWNSVSGQGA